MLIYLMLIALIVIAYFCLKVNDGYNKKKYCIVIGLALFFIMAFRDFSMGVDLKGLYIPYFETIKNLNFYDVILFCKARDTETVYYIFTKLISLFTKDAHVYLGIVAIPYIFFSSRFIYKYSKNPLLSFLMFIALNYYCFSFSALRHTLAASLLIFAFDYVLKKKPIKFLLIVFIASMLHRSAIVFLLVYPIAFININWKQFICIFIILMCSLFFKEYLLKMLFSIVNIKHYNYYNNNGTTLSLTFFCINFLIYIFMIYLYNEDKNKEFNKIFLNIHFLSIIFAALTPILAEMFRVSLFFGVFSIASLPNAISYSNYPSNKKIYSIVLSIIFILYFLIFTLYNNKLIPYVSMWS